MSDGTAGVISNKNLLEISAGIPEEISKGFLGGTLKKIFEGISVGYLKKFFSEIELLKKSLSEIPS